MQMYVWALQPSLFKECAEKRLSLEMWRYHFFHQTDKQLSRDTNYVDILYFDTCR